MIQQVLFTLLKSTFLVSSDTPCELYTLFIILETLSCVNNGTSLLFYRQLCVYWCLLKCLLFPTPLHYKTGKVMLNFSILLHWFEFAIAVLYAV
jgi:hypothetical protein